MKTYTSALLVIGLCSIPAIVGIGTGSGLLSLFGLIVSFLIMKSLNIFN